jgi:hypothetical protein
MKPKSVPDFFIVKLLTNKREWHILKFSSYKAC